MCVYLGCPLYCKPGEWTNLGPDKARAGFQAGEAWGWEVGETELSWMDTTHPIPFLGLLGEVLGCFYLLHSLSGLPSLSPLFPFVFPCSGLSSSSSLSISRNFHRLGLWGKSWGDCR